MFRRALAVAALALAASAPSAAARTTLNIIPHGESEPGVTWASTPGLLPPDTQAKMYDRLTPLFRNVTDAQLVPSADGTGYFKSAELLAQDDPSFISSKSVSGSTKATGAVSATIKRDPYGVPHIYGDTDAGVIFGAGYVTAEDRALLLNLARFNGVAALIDMPGVPAIELVLGLYAFAPAKKLVAEVTERQTAAIRAAGKDGEQLLRDIDTYIAGINLWYSQRAPTAPRFTRTDIYALNAIKSQLLGEGGGEEVANAMMLDGLRSELGARAGDGAYQDLRGRYDPESTATTTATFDYQTKVSVARPSGMVRLRNGSFQDAYVRLPGQQAQGAAAASASHPRGPNVQASNILIASGDRSVNGDPLFVGGPQIGYTFPGLTVEMQLKSPNINVRGATSAPFPGYMLIGRGEDFAWTLTSAGVDVIDTFAETLCGGSKTKYLYKGRCRSMEVVDAGVISGRGQKASARFRRTVHGPLIGYGRVPGSNELVALSQRRSSYGRETLDQLFNQALTFGRVKSATDFIAAAARTPQTFNSFYASRTESAFFTSGHMPLRAKGVNPDLPVSGEGRHEWTGFLPASRHPQVVNPASGYIVNWNNKPAKGFPAGDERWSEHSIQRVDMLNAELGRRAKHTLADVLAAANAGATQDVRIARLWPTLKRMLAKGKSPSARATRLVELLQQWHDAGASRVDSDLDGKLDAPGAIIIDTAWDALATAGLCDRLGPSLCSQLEQRNSRFDAPPGGQYGGWHQYMWKDLRALLKESVGGRYNLTYCGKGSVSACARKLWAALDAAGRKLAARQGPDPAAWRQTTKSSEIRFGPLPLATMQYTNRPSGIHQVMEFGG